MLSFNRNIHSPEWEVEPGSSFVHAPLDLASSKTLRLIEVLPLEEHEPIHCKLIHATTDSAYVCLSYVWGTDEPSYVVYIDRRPYSVRGNLFNFLLYTSQRLHRDSSRSESRDHDLCSAGWIRQYIWIDALCIDQQNTLEWNHQVQHMGNIYGNAQRVLVLLSETGFALPLIEKLHTSGVVVDFRSRPDSRVFMKGFCEDPYWTRAWTTQEVLLAKDITFLTNKAEADLIVLKTALGDSITSFGNGDAHERFQPLYDMLRRQGTYTLLENVWRFRNKQCLNRRDIVYSLLSISQLNMELEVDYEVTSLSLALRVLEASSPGLCLCSAKILQAVLGFADDLKIGGDSPFANVDLQPPLPEVNGLCSCCSGTLKTKPIADETRSFDRIRVYCLSCSHNSSIRPCVNQADSALHHGHLVLARYSLEPSTLPWRTYWLPPNTDTMSTIHEIFKPGAASRSSR